MQLYNVPKNTPIRIAGAPPIDLLFHHLDGMYSYCTNKEGEVVHIAAGTEVEVVNE